MAISGRMPSYRSWKRCWAAKPVDLVLSDMAPNKSGVDAVDQPRAMHLAELAMDFADHHLQPGGTFLIKLFQGVGFDDYVRELRRRYAQGGDPQAGGLAQAFAGGLCPGAGQARAMKQPVTQRQRDRRGVQDERLGQESAAVGGRRRRADGGVPELSARSWRRPGSRLFASSSQDVADDRIKKVDIAERRAHDQRSSARTARKCTTYAPRRDEDLVNDLINHKVEIEQAPPPSGVVAGRHPDQLPAVTAVHRHLDLLHAADAAGRRQGRDELRPFARQAAGRGPGQGHLRRRRRLRRGQGRSRPSWSSSCATRASSRSSAARSRAAC